MYLYFISSPDCMAKNTNGAKSAAKPFVVSEEYWVIARTV